MKIPRSILLIAFLHWTFTVAALNAATAKGGDFTAAIRAVAAAYPDPSFWDAALFFPVGSASAGVASFKGVGVDVPLKLLPVPGSTKSARLVVEEATLVTDWGTATAMLKLRLTSEQSGGLGSMALKARLIPDGFTKDQTGSGIVAFHVGLDGALGLEIKGVPPQLVSALQTNILPTLEKQLHFALPVPLDFVREMGLDEDLLLNAGGDGWVKIHVKVPRSEFRLKIARVETIFVPRGLWLCLAFEGTPNRTVVAPTIPQSVEQSLVAYQKQAARTGRLLVNGEFLQNIVNDYGQRDAKFRTASVKAVSHQGKLFDSGGDVGVEVWPENDQASGAITVEPSADWTPDGLKVGCGYRANAVADLHVHIRPGISGGFGTSVGAKGETSGWIEGTMGIRQTGSGPAKALLLVPRLGKREEMTVELRTDGRASTKTIGGVSWKWSMPSFGARITLPVPPDVVPPIGLLTSKPVALVPLPSSGNGPAPTLCAILSPEGATTTSQGYRVDFTITFANLTAAEIKARGDAIDGLLREPMQSGLAVGKIEVLLGKWSIGPNNDLVRVVVAIIGAAKNTIKEMTRGGKNVEREASRAAANIRKTADIAVKDTGRELTTARKNTGREITTAQKNIGRETTTFWRNTLSASQAAKEAFVDKPRKFIEKTLGVRF